MKMYTFKDFATGKIKRTRGKSTGWCRGGPLGIQGAIFSNPRSKNWVPGYCLTAETRERIATEPKV